MSDIGYFLTSKGVDIQPLRSYNSEADQTLGAYIALALVDPAAGLRMGETFESVVQTGATIVSTIKALCLTDQAYFFGMQDIIGQEADPANTSEAEVFGTGAGPRLTDTITATQVWRLNHAYSSRQFLNMLMANREFDLYMFTNNSVEVAYFGDHGVAYSAISNAKGNKDAKITGGFTTMYKSFDGLIPVQMGVVQSSLKNDVKFTIDDPALTLVTAASCSTVGRKKFTKLEASAGSMVFATDPVNACLTWYCTNSDGSALPASGKGSFNSLTKTLTLPSTLAVGTYIYKVFCLNATGVKGEVYIEVAVN